MYRPFEALPMDGKVISVIGSGGKTTLLRRLSERLPGTAILTTSTHIYPFPGVPLVKDGGLDAIRAALARSRVICLGTPQPTGKLATPALPFEALASLADHVLIEADGAAGHPLKAHRPWEPVIPPCSDMTVCVIGASGIGRPASVACHCPELFCALAGMTPGEPVTVEHIARVVNREALANCCLVNQIDALSDVEEARRLCELIDVDACPCALALLER